MMFTFLAAMVAHQYLYGGVRRGGANVMMSDRCSKILRDKIEPEIRRCLVEAMKDPTVRRIVEA